MKVNRAWEPAFAGGGATFQKVPLVLDPEQLSGADVVVMGAPMDEFVTNRPGARFGPRAIRLADDSGGDPRLRHIDAGIDPFEVLAIVDHGDAEVVPGNPLASHRAISEMVGRVFDAGAVPMILGGDHSIAYPNIKTVAERFEFGDLAVVQFDTHADTGTENWGVERAHGTPFHYLVEENIIPGDRLIQVGLRGYWPWHEEFEWARAKGMRWHRMEEVDRRGIGAVIDTVMEEISDAPNLFLSVDIDVLDPAFAPGTGTPEPGGMTTRELLPAVRRLAAERGLAGMDLVEVSPPYDHADITALAGNRIVMEALVGLALNRAEQEPRPEDPR
ncbi:MAG: agmatinase [Actinobacteria bacterium]|nr:agmatinase [Actinomycetota bacterium]